MLLVMNIEEIKRKVRDAAKWISDNDSSVWYTSELNICSHLRQVLHTQFPEYDLDVELVKYNNQRPDITIHHRGNNSDNFVVFEVKKNPTLKQFTSDLRKIESTYFNEPYNYRYGILVSIGKLPSPLPTFDTSKIGILEVYGWEEVVEPAKNYAL